MSKIRKKKSNTCKTPKFIGLVNKTRSKGARDFLIYQTMKAYNIKKNQKFVKTQSFINTVLF